LSVNGYTVEENLHEQWSIGGVSVLPPKSHIPVICIALNYWGKHKEKILIWDIKLTRKQPATTEITHWSCSLFPLD